MSLWKIWTAAALLAGGTGWADLVVTQKVEESGAKRPPAEIVLKIKGAKIRADISPDVSLIMDTATGETVTLCHDRKTALVLSGSAAQRIQEQLRRLQAEARAGGDEPAPPPRLAATGKRETVSGRETELYTAENGPVKITWWIAKKGDDWEKYLPQLAPLQRSPMVRLAGGLGFLPPGLDLPGPAVKTEWQAPDGRRIATTLLAIREEPVENLDFAVPRDYRPVAEPLFPFTPP